MNVKYIVIHSKDLSTANAREKYEEKISSMEKEGWRKNGPELKVDNCLYQTMEKM